MELRTDTNAEKVPVDQTIPGEVYKLQGANSYYLRVITCASVRDAKTEGFKFISLPDGVIVEMKSGGGVARLVHCTSRLSVN